MRGALDFGLLGELEVTVGGKRVLLGAGKLRVVLAALLLRANQTVSADELIDRLWGDDPPGRARATMQAYVMRLRQALGDDSTKSRLIHTQPGGYRIDISPEQLDLCRFRGLVDEANDLASAAGAEKLREALSLWRGAPLGDVPSESLRRDVVPGLIEERLRVVDRCIEMELELRRHDELIGELTTLTSDYPLREQFRGQLMLALFRSGRQAEALESYREIRDLLVDELGVDPGPGLRALHERILRDDPALAASAVVRHGGRNDLPGDIADFTGREQEMARLLAALPGQRDIPATAVVIEAIDGMAGIGKTAFAVHAAHHLADCYPHAQLFIDLHGYTPGQNPTDPMVALDRLLRAVGVPGDQIPHELQARAALWRAELADRKALVVLDNAATAAQVRPLLPGNPGCLVLVTSRRRLADLEAARILSLDVLPRADAIALFARIVADDRVSAEPAAVQEMVALCGDLPLAIRIAAARLATRPMWTVASLVERLRDGQGRLTELTVGDRSVAAAFTLSYQHLTSEQQRLFRLLGLHPGPDIDPYAASSLAHGAVDATARLLEDLVDAHLLQQPQPGRYRFHDLLRQHAQHTAHHTDPDADQQAAVTRLVDHYLHTAHAADRLLRPYREPIPLGLPAHGRPHPLDDEPAALAWFDAEHASLLATHQLAVERGWQTPVWQLAWTLDTFHWRRGHLHDAIIVWQAGLAAADHLGDPATHTRAHQLLGAAYAQAGQPAEAVGHLEQAQTLAEHTSDTRAQAHNHHTLAWAWEKWGEDQRALEHATNALHLYRALALPVWEADALNAVGWYHARLGHHEQARTHCEAALTLARDHHYREGEANTLDSLGYLAHRTGRDTHALDYYQQAHALLRDLGDTYQEANTLDHLGQTLHTLGQRDQARHVWQLALQLYQAQHRITDAERARQQLNALNQHQTSNPPGTKHPVHSGQRRQAQLRAPTPYTGPEPATN